MYPSLEITLPVSPRRTILLDKRGISDYLDIGKHHVDEINRRTRFECSEYFVSFSNATKPIWFDQGVEPEDSWAKRNPTPPQPRGPWDPPATL